jgi:dTDP-glucose 4,6-dehydratase/UDP-glucose 4-epimerase
MLPDCTHPSRDGRILISGGAGFIGHHLAARFKRDRRSVVVVDNLMVRPLLPTVGRLIHKDVAEMTPDDLTDVACVYHLAAHKNVPQSFRAAPSYLDNVVVATHLLELAAQTRVPRLILASTCEVYGESPIQPIPESHPGDPRSPYAVSKLAVDLMANVYRRVHHLNITVVRLFNVYGPGERPDAVVPAFCLQLLSGKPIGVEGDGTQSRDFTHVSDVVEALYRLAFPAQVPHVVNVGSGYSVSVNQVADDLIGLHAGGSKTHLPARLEEINTFTADTRLASDVIGFKSSVAWREGLKDTYHWWKTHV